MVLIREGTKEDCVHIEAMIREFAADNGSPDGPEINAQQLERDGFSEQHDKRLFHVYVVQLDGQSQQLIGYLLFHYKYSGWYGKCVWISHLFVKSEHRNQGVGAQLLSAVAKYALENDCARVEWYCYSRQEASIRFYKRSGAIDASIGLNKYTFDFNALKVLANNQK